MKTASAKKAIIALIIANIIWGAASPIFKYSLAEIDPYFLAFARFSLASLFLMPIVAMQKKLRLPTRKEFWEILPYPIFGITLNIIFYFWSLKLTQSINAPIISSSGPMIIMVLGILFLGEKATLQRLIGGVLSFIGVIVIIIRPVLETGIADTNLLGNILLVIATLAAVAQAIVGKRIFRHFDPLLVTFWSFVIGTITFAPLLIGHLPTVFGFRSAVGVVFGSVFSSTVAYSLFAWGLARMDAGEAGLFTYIDPVAAVIIAYPLLGEKPDLLFVLGSILVFGGLFISEKKLFTKPALSGTIGTV